MQKTIYDVTKEHAGGNAGRKMTACLFDSPSEFSTYAERDGQGTEKTGSSESFYGGDTFQAALRKTRQGDMSRVPDSDKLLDRFESLSFASHGATWADDVCGAIPNVQAYICGSPLSMGMTRAIILDKKTVEAIRAKIGNAPIEPGASVWASVWAGVACGPSR